MIETEQKSKLPAGWRWVRIDDVVDLFPGAWGQDAAFDGSMAVRVVGTSHISNEGMLDPSDAPIRFLSKKESVAVCREGDLMVVKSSGSAANIRSGKTAICPGDLSEQIACSNFLMRLVPKATKAEPFLLWKYLNCEYTKEFIRRIVVSSTYPNIKWATFRSLQIPLPALPEQKRIAGILTKQMDAAEKARKACEEKLHVAQQLPDSYLYAVFNSPESKKWTVKKVEEICEITARQVDPKIPEYGNLPHVNGENIESGTRRLTFLKTAKELGMISGKYLFEKGDVLYSKLRPYLRKVFVADFKGVCSADMYPICVNKAIADPSFFAWLLLSDDFTRYANEESMRARMPKLNRKQLFAWKAKLPSLKEQRRLVEILEKQASRVETLCKKIESELETINKLPASLLQQAFTGKL